MTDHPPELPEAIGAGAGLAIGPSSLAPLEDAALVLLAATRAVPPLAGSAAVIHLPASSVIRPVRSAAPALDPLRHIATTVVRPMTTHHG